MSKLTLGTLVIFLLSMLNSMEAEDPEMFTDVTGFNVSWGDWDDFERGSQLSLDTMNRLQSDLVPALTSVGFLKMSMPENLHEFIKSQRDLMTLHNEHCRRSAMSNCDEKTYLMMDVHEPKVFNKVLELSLITLVQKWSGVALRCSRVYGIRRYTRGAWLAAHVDRLNTHVVSAILQVDQKVDEPWPLRILDHQGEAHQVLLQPGEMLLYESAKLPHGRQLPLKGEYFDNVFVHFKPLGQWFKESQPNQQLTPINKEQLQAFV